MKVGMALLSVALFLGGCASAAEPGNAVSEQRNTKAASKSGSEAPAGLRVNGEQAMRYLRDLVAFGPRPSGSVAQKKQQDYLRSHLKGDRLEEDVFTAATPVGKVEMRNFIAKFPGTDAGMIVIASHYDTAYPIPHFVGANDGGSSSALLLAIADQLRGKKLTGPSVWLVWFDGEEAFQNWTNSDSVYGSRHLAEKWKNDGTAAKIKAFLLADMVGDSDLNIDRDQNSAPWLLDTIQQAATRLGVQSHFFARQLAVDDDHIPFKEAGVPVADLIDFDYGYDNVFWHTKEDTLDKVSAKSLKVVGDTLLEALSLLGVRAK